MTLRTYVADDGIASDVATAIRNIGEAALRQAWQMKQTDPADIAQSQSAELATEPEGGWFFEDQTAAALAMGIRALGQDAINSDRRPLKLSPPLLIREVPNKALLGPDVLGHAVVTGWRYFLPDPPTTVDFDIGSKDTGTITCGAIVERQAEAAWVAERNFANRPDIYHAGILEVPALQVSALTIEGKGEVHFIVFRDPGPDSPLQIETARSFGQRLAKIIRTRERSAIYDEYDNALVSGAALEVDTSQLDNINEVRLPPAPPPRTRNRAQNFG